MAAIEVRSRLEPANSQSPFFTIEKTQIVRKRSQYQCESGLGNSWVWNKAGVRAIAGPI
jgi:hypothetical protein